MNETMNKFSPKASFLMGLATGFLVICTIGFFVLLGVVLTDKKSTAQAGTGTTSTAGTSTGTQPPESPTDRDTDGDSVADSKDQCPDQPGDPARNGCPEIKVAGIQKDDHVYGDPNAKITIVEYSDTECPFCKRFHPTMKQVVDSYKGKVNWVYRHFPLEQLHQKAKSEAMATECAAELGGNDGFWKFTDRLYEVTPSNDGLDAAKLPEIAKEVGLDQGKFEECVKSGRHAEKVQRQYQQGIESGAQGTPYAVILAGDQKIPIPGAVPFEQIKATIEPLLQ